ncbi:MAG: hypothetical protein M3Y31_10555 [Gemmatimonadota bacterium]|nr:hypothetical protein [Gemmatimonadota bacterium]
MIEPGEPYGFDWSFIGLERRAGVLQRVYKVYVGDRLLCGAVVRRRVLLPLWPRAAGWDDPERWVDPARMERYDGMNVTSPFFIRRARGNFHISRARLSGVEVVPRNGAPGGITHSGALRLRFDHGRRREFLLLGRQNTDALLSRLQPGGR